MTLKIVIDKYEFERIFKLFEEKWKKDINFIKHDENYTDYKESKRHIKEKALSNDIETLKNRLMEG